MGVAFLFLLMSHTTLLCNLYAQKTDSATTMNKERFTTHSLLGLELIKKIIKRYKFQLSLPKLCIS
jgi:hypothetical protein